MENKQILCLIGNKGSGKDYGYKVIESYLKDFNLKTERIAFADALKEEYIEFLNKFIYEENDPITLQELEDNKETHRIGLQEWGDMRRKEDENYFIKKVYYKIKKSDANLIVITDMRLVKEFYAIHKLSIPTSFLRINTDRVNKDSHITEQEVNKIPCPWQIYNDYSPVFVYKLIELMNSYLDLDRDLMGEY